MTSHTFYRLACGFIFALLAQFASAAKILPPFAWPEIPPEAFKSNDTKASLVESFVNSLMATKDLPRVAVQEFRFVSLDGRTFQLVATIDLSGRGLFDSVVVVLRRSPSNFGFEVVDSDAPHLLATELLNLGATALFVSS